jgi:hypothetical protein
MMDQTHIGYTSWRSPLTNIMPELTFLTLPDHGDFGVAVEGSDAAWPGAAGEPTLPAFDSLNQQRSYLEVFARSGQPLRFKAVADQSWIRLAEGPAPGAGQDRRIWVDIDWNTAPAGRTGGTITLGNGEHRVAVKLTALKATAEQAREARGCFGGLTGPISIPAAEATTNIPVGHLRWEILPDYGRYSAAMEVFPVTADPIEPPQPAPQLGYPVYFARAGNYEVDLITSPTLDVIPTRGLGVSVSVDDQPPQVVKVFTPDTSKSEDFLGAAYDANTRNNDRVMHFRQTVGAPGKHTLKITMVDPTVVVMQIVIHDAPLPPSYFGPPARLD